MRAAKEQQTSFRRQFEATTGESGARAAVLAFRPAVREAAQRNTLLHVSSSASSHAAAALPSSTTSPTNPAAHVDSGGAKLSYGARTPENGGKEWAQISWSARLAACRAAEEAAREAVLQLASAMVAQAKARAEVCA